MKLSREQRHDLAGFRNDAYLLMERQDRGIEPDALDVRNLAAAVAYIVNVLIQAANDDLAGPVGRREQPQLVELK